jgi:hypothetical protein
MKRQIRRGVYETNSSSTHSVSIYNNSKRRFQDIPRNSEVVLNDTYEYGTDIFDEVGKLNYVVTMLASIIERKYDYDELKVESFENMINLNWFRWLADVVREESNTEVIYKCPTYSDGRDKTYQPYYDTTYDEYDSIETILAGDDSDMLDDEMKFKERIKDIIYNPSIVIEDKENEY